MTRKTPEEEHDDVMSLTADEIRAELKSRGIDTSQAVAYVLRLVREAKRKRDRWRAEQN